MRLSHSRPDITTLVLLPGRQPPIPLFRCFCVRACVCLSARAQKCEALCMLIWWKMTGIYHRHTCEWVGNGRPHWYTSHFRVLSSLMDLANLRLSRLFSFTRSFHRAYNTQWRGQAKDKVLKSFILSENEGWAKRNPLLFLHPLNFLRQGELTTMIKWI